MFFVYMRVYREFQAQPTSFLVYR